jgi:hypothetical protein
MTRSKPFDDPVLYEQLGPGSIKSANAVVPLVMDLLAPSSVVDFGSGTGAWLASFSRAGVQTIQGLEGGSPDTSQLLIDPSLVQAADFEQAVDLGRRFDLAMSVEVAEHLPATRASQFVASIARHSDAALFSAAIPGQGGAHHLNEQWPSYWADLFAQHEFDCFDPFRWRIWSDERIEWWYRQNILLFARHDVADRLRQHGHVPESPHQLVHPKLYEQTRAKLEERHSIRANARDLAQGVRRRFVDGGSTLIRRRRDS